MKHTRTLPTLLMAVMATTAIAHPVSRDLTTILPPSEGPVLFGGRPAATPQAMGFWTPTRAEIQKLEADLPRLHVADYYRQYLGVTQGGRRLIAINGFRSDVAPEFTGGKYDWHRHAVFVMDGGRAFFHATYDPRTRQFVTFQYNGLG